MKILLIDTCGATGSIALAEGANIATASLPGRTASEGLVPAIRDLAGRSLHSLDAIAVVHGPGSFTGVRVGLSAAKGLSHALNVPLVAISRLAVLAYLADPPSGAPVHALLDAGRGEFYYGQYVDGTCLREAMLTRDEVLSAIASAAATADGCLAWPSEPSVSAVIACEPIVAESLAARLIPEPTAQDALPLALRRIQQQDFDDIAGIDANYLRRTDAEIFAKPSPRAAASQPGTAVP